MALWTDEASQHAEYIEGLLLEAPKGGCTSHVAESAVRAGYLVAFGTDKDTNQLQVQPLPAAPAADDDAISTSVSSGVAAQILETAAELDGVIGLDRIYPARCVTVDTDADAGWDGPLGYIEFTVFGEDADGRKISERLIRNNVGAVAQTLTTFQAFSKVDRVDVPASNAATGSATIGVSSDYIEFGKLDHPGVALYDVAREEGAAAASTFDANETLSCCHQGRIAVTAQDAVDPGDPVFVRITAGGGIAVGAFYGEQAKTASASFARLLGARWRDAADAGELAAIEIGG